MSYVWFALGVAVGFATALVLAYVSKSRWTKIEREASEEIDKLRDKVG